MTINQIIIIVTGIISFLSFSKPEWVRDFKHWPYMEHRENQWYRLLTGGFLHAGWLHLLINVFVLYMFGDYVETKFTFLFGSTFGPINYLLLYILTIIAANLPSYFRHKGDPYFSAIGASGAVSGIVFVFILFLPWQMLYLYGLLPIPGIVAGVLYLYYSSWAGKNRTDNIDHSAHFYGAIFGILFTIAIQPSVFLEFIDKLVSDFPF